MKLEKIKISITGKDRNYNYTLEPENEIESIKEAIEYLELIQDDFEKKEELPF